MAIRLGLLKSCGGANSGLTLGLRRWVHATAAAAAAIPPPLDASINPPVQSPPLRLPGFDPNPYSGNNHFHNFGFGFPGFSFGGSMELMAVPKKKVSPHKRGIRNGPKALKPTPVIIRCKICHKVKLPHFYCCSGDRGKNGEQSN
uniref:Large ribosomal subunit protein bL32m n=1 Tax=Rhizophora mucronata TaxID=61149 RepID=A0A2P2J1N1_RHIMU